MAVQDLDLSNPTVFAVVAGLALIDGVIPLVPARTAVIGVGVMAGTGDPRAYPLLGVATAAAFLSDNISYHLGAHLWPRLAPHVTRGERAQRLLHWVEHQLASQGGALVALSRIIPGGPTPITLMAGSVGFPRRRFCLAAATSAVLWSAYAFTIGLAGESVTQQPLVGLAVGVILAAALNLGFRLRFHHRARIRPQRQPGPTPATPADEAISIRPPHRADRPDTGTAFPGDTGITEESVVNIPTSPTTHSERVPVEETR